MQYQVQCFKLNGHF